MNKLEVKNRLKETKLLDIVDEICKLTNESYDEGEKDGRDNQLEEDQQEWQDGSEFNLIKYELCLEYIERIKSGEHIRDIEQELLGLSAIILHRWVSNPHSYRFVKNMKETPINDCALALMCLAQMTGGYERLADMIDTEWMKKFPQRQASHREAYNMRKWEQWEYDFLILNYGKVGIGQIAQKLGRTYESVDGKIFRVAKDGKFVRKRAAKRFRK